MKQILARLSTLVVAVCISAVLVFVPELFAATDFGVRPGRAAGPITITLGPDHNLWFTENAGLKIGRITPAGVVTEFPISGSQGLTGITSGPDGNLWFTDEFAAKIGRISTSGTGLTIFSLPVNSHPQGITAGADGNLWFVDQIQSGAATRGFKIGKITLSGQITEYETGINSGIFDAENYYPAQITKGPDGSLWFTNPQAGALGKNFVGEIGPGGTKIYPTGDTPIAITSGPDGNLWVTELVHVAKITTSGVETEYPLRNGASGSDGITTGPDGNIWFTELNTVAYVTPGGLVTELSRGQFSNFFSLAGIAGGPDGALWFLGQSSSNIGRVTTSGQLANTYVLNVGSGTGWDTLGPDAAIWFTGAFAGLVGSIDTSGVVRTFPIGQNARQPPRPYGIVTGPDLNLWFVEQGSNNVAKITTSGAITEYSVGQQFAGLWTITAGPDGNLWFAEYQPSYNNIVRIRPDGVMTAFPIPTPSALALYITPGPDGNLWFTELGAQQVGKIDPSSGLITEYPFPGTNKGLAALVTGPDGNLWIMEGTLFGGIAKFSTAGTLLAEYQVQFQTLLDIKVGSDGALWFPQFYPNGVARITTSGVASTVTLTSPNALGNDVAIGTDGKLWVAQVNAGSMGRMSAIGGTGDTISPTYGTPFSGAVASFVDGTPTAMQADFGATIDWGDGTRNSGIVSGPTGGPFTVSGTHTYTVAGTYILTITLHDNVDNANYQASPGVAHVH